MPTQFLQMKEVADRATSLWDSLLIYNFGYLTNEVRTIKTQIFAARNL